MCQSRHEDTNWRFKKWFDNKLEEEIDGWACSKHFRPRTSINLTDKRLAPEREKYKKDLIQPFRQGEPSQEFADAYPKQAKKFFKGEKKKPKKVWD